jgi:ligand-binding SRPBCC domain-containing protein
MRIERLHRRQWVPAELGEAFAFFERPQNLELITPPWLRFRLLTPEPIAMRRGLTLDYRLRALGVPMRWRSEIAEYDPPFGFRDVQVAGPYRLWDHRHRFWEEGAGTAIEDLVLYELPLGPIGLVANRLAVRPRLEAIFDFRREEIARRLGPAADARRAAR